MVRYHVAIMSSMVEQGVASIGPLIITFCVCFHGWGIDVIIISTPKKKKKRCHHHEVFCQESGIILLPIDIYEGGKVCPLVNRLNAYKESLGI